MSPRAYPPRRHIQDDQRDGIGAAHPASPRERGQRHERRPDQPRELELPERRDRRERDEQRRDDHAEPEVDRIAVERLADECGAPAGAAEAGRGERVRDAGERSQDQHAEHRVRDVPVVAEAERRLHHARAARDDQRDVEDDQRQQVVGGVGPRVGLALDLRVLVQRA